MGIKTAAMEQNDRMDGAFEPRLEDYRLLTGAGNFQDDEATAGAAWGVFVRSPHAFADIRGVDTASAQAAPGVLAVLTAAALDATGISSVSVPAPVPDSVAAPALARP
jgi:carbon-monoxide dehydrogenase large subunit